MSTSPHATRDERRRRTEEAILAAARELFGSEGFERTTIRGVASRAGVDPALVMQYYGSKEGLFAEAARWDESHERVLTADLETLPADALDDLLDRMEEGGGEAAAALLRSCLTHPVAAKVMRDDVMCSRRDAVAALLEGEDADLRAGVFASMMMGLAMSRYLLRMEPVASASREDLHRVVEPLLRALAGPPLG